VDCRLLEQSRASVHREHEDSYNGGGERAVGDGGLATGPSVSLYYPRNPALDASGNLYLVDAQNDRIREVSAADQTISTVVGNGIPCAQRPAVWRWRTRINASLFMPRTVTVEPSGNLLVADDGDLRIREVTGSTGIIKTIVGSGNLCAALFRVAATVDLR